MDVRDLMDVDLLSDMVERGFIRERRHPSLPYRILGYTEEAQYSRTWNEATLQCRGLVLDDGDRVIARPFRKFFNDTEHDGELLPPLDVTAPVEVTDKLDGSLGILVPIPGGHIVATRGSFESGQAIWATELYNRRYADQFRPVEGKTYLFEVVFKANRIVVEYDFEDLVLLGAVDNVTGKVLSTNDIDWPGPKAAQFPHATLAAALSAPVRNNAEGFVVRRLDTDVMVKIKLERYVELHRIVTGLSEKTVWEHACAGKPIMELIADLPDEFHVWVTEVWGDLQQRHTTLLSEAAAAFTRVAGGLSADATRKDFAVAVQRHPEPAMRPYLFMQYDGHAAKLDAAIWRSLKPVGDTAMVEATL